MALTLEQARTQAAASVGYEEGGLAMARDYRDALRVLLILEPARSGDANSLLVFGERKEQLARVEGWIDDEDATANPPRTFLRADLTQMRAHG